MHIFFTLTRYINTISQSIGFLPWGGNYTALFKNSKEPKTDCSLPLLREGSSHTGWRMMTDIVQIVPQQHVWLWSINRLNNTILLSLFESILDEYTAIIHFHDIVWWYFPVPDLASIGVQIPSPESPFPRFLLFSPRLWFTRLCLSQSSGPY